MKNYIYFVPFKKKHHTYTHKGEHRGGGRRQRKPKRNILKIPYIKRGLYSYAKKNSEKNEYAKNKDIFLFVWNL